MRSWQQQMLRKVLRLRRRPEESFKTYNMRTAAIIHKWCRGARISLLYVRVLKAVYKAAWREFTFSLDGGDSPLGQARLCRCAMWWETWRAVATPSKRRKLGILHASPGAQSASWETPFVALWGCCWRGRRDSSKTVSQWMRGFPDFANSLCELWKLPGTELSDVEPTYQAPFSVKLPTCREDLPHLRHNSREDHWDSDTGRVWIQTDNQQLQQVFAGLSQLDSESSLRAPCIRVSRMMQSMLRGGFRPRRETADFIEWDDRSYNTYADFAANVCLDLGHSWGRKDDAAIQEAKQGQSNFRISCDGALRKGCKASAGLAIFSYMKGRRKLLYIGGCLLDGLQSAFVAELLALEWSLQEFRLL